MNFKPTTVAQYRYERDESRPPLSVEVGYTASQTAYGGSQATRHHQPVLHRGSMPDYQPGSGRLSHHARYEIPVQTSEASLPYRNLPRTR
jgi:hypothetical protein